MRGTSACLRWPMANSMPRNWQRRWHLRLTMKTGVRHGSSITWWALRCAPRRLRAQLAKEALAARPRTLVQAPLMAPARSAATSAANASVFRWKMLAGLASLAALGVIGWSALAPLQGGGFAGVPAQSQAAASAEPLVAVADTDG